MATVFTVMSYGGMALAVICLIVAVVLFIKWNIPKVFGDITGSTERKAIERIRQEGYEVNASKRVFPKSSGATGKIKVRKMESGRLDGRAADSQAAAPLEERDTSRESAVTKEEPVTPSALQPHVVSEETTVLEPESPELETVVLSSTSIVEEETTVLKNKEPATTILAENSVDGVIQIPEECLTEAGKVAKVLDFVITHTEDRIPDEFH